MKLALCAALLVTMATAGFRIGSSYRWREKLLAQLVREMQRLEEQVRMGRPLRLALQQPEMRLFSQMADHVEVSGALDAWQQVCRESGDMLDCMEAPERQIMEAFWAEMGALGRRSQLDRFEEATRALVRLRDQAAAEAAQRSRLYGSLGVLLGLAAVVLLW